MRSKSIVTNLCQFVHFTFNEFEHLYQVDTIYTDLAKAFDVVNHNVLLCKLRAYGLCNNLVEMFCSMLCNRCQCVEYQNCQSNRYFTPSGVTQGSNLGPILFILFLLALIAVFLVMLMI